MVLVLLVALAAAPVGVQPGTVESGAVQPDAVEPSAVQVGAVEPRAAVPRALAPVGAQPPSAEPRPAVEPVAVEPATMVDPVGVVDDRARDTATLGVVTAVVAAGLALLVPLSDGPHPGSAPSPLILGSAGFGVVALMRPVVFFSGQPARPKPTFVNNVLRVVGTLTAVVGLATFISALALRSNQPWASSWAMAGAAGLEALSLAAFSADARLGLR